MATISRHELLQMATHDVVTLDELREKGVTQRGLRTLERRDHLFRRHPAVFLTTDRPSYKTLCFAAVRHCGEDALVSAWSGAWLWGVVEKEPEGWPHVLVPAHRMTHKANGIKVHRSRRPDPGTTRDLIPVTSLNRTIEDIAGFATPSLLRAVIGRAERAHALSLEGLYDAARSRKLKRVLETYVAGRGLTDSELEARFYEIVAQAGLPLPHKQRRRTGGRVDFIWPELRLIVEVDGYDSHRGRIAFADDRRRDREHWREGLQTLRYTWADVTLTPERVVADLVLAAERVARLSL